MKSLFVFAAALALGACTAEARFPPSAESPILGAALPPFKARALDGATVDAAALRGKPVVVKFFADYCEPCKRTLPAAQRLSRENADVYFLGVSEDDRATVAASVALRYGIDFTVVHDASHALQGRFRVRVLPATFVADSAGVIRWVGGPEQTEEDLARAVAAATATATAAR